MIEKAPLGRSQRSHRRDGAPLRCNAGGSRNLRHGLTTSRRFWTGRCFSTALGGCGSSVPLRLQPNSCMMLSTCRADLSNGCISHAAQTSSVLQTGLYWSRKRMTTTFNVWRRTRYRGRWGDGVTRRGSVRCQSAPYSFMPAEKGLATWAAPRVGVQPLTPVQSTGSKPRLSPWRRPPASRDRLRRRPGRVARSACSAASAR